MQPTWAAIFPAWDLPARIPPVLADVLGPGPRDENERAFAAAIDAAPKIELHVHMEAAVPAAFYAALNARRPLFDDDSLPARRAPFADLAQFIAAWVDQTRLIEDEALLADLACAFVASRRALGIVYSEVHISPVDFTLVRDRFKVPAKVLDFRKALTQYLRGLKQGLALHPGIQARLIVDVLWVSTDDECREMLAALEHVLVSGDAHDAQGVPLIAAIGMGGPEVATLAPQKIWVASECRRLGLKLDIHSGENTTLDEHRFAVQTLKPDRVGHGIAGAGAATPWFFDGPIAACPTSNLLTGSFAGRLAEHPVDRMRARGGLVSINTDDPLLFGVPLALEWVALRRAFGWGMSDFQDLNQQAAASALMPDVLARVYAP